MRRSRMMGWYRVCMAVLAALLVWSVWQSVRAADAAAAAPAPSALSTNMQSYLSFGLDRVEMLRRDFLGNPLWQYVASLLYVFLAFYASKLVDWLVRVLLKGWAKRTKSELDDLLLDVVGGPVKIIVFVILLHVGLNMFQWPAWAEEFFSKGLYIVVAASVTYAAVKVVDLFMGHWKNRLAQEEDKAFDDQLIPIVRKSLKVFIVIIAILVTSQNVGLNITGVLASLSIGGLALGLAAQDTVANLFGAVAVFMDKPFRIGDRIKLDSVDGTVESIGLRSTRVRNLDGHLITIPNKTMGNATITNITKRPNIKTVMDISVTYDTPTARVKRALEILEEIYRKHPMTHDVWISFNRFADSSLNILVIHWWNSTVYKDYLQGMQELNLQVKERFDAEGIDFAFPTRTLYVRQDSDWRVDARNSAPPGGVEIKPGAERA